MQLITTGIVLFLAVIPLHFVKAAVRVPATQTGTRYELLVVLLYFVVSATSLMCYLAGPLLFCVGLWQLLIGVVIRLW